jgi:putative Mg2+ transporter-C (MgtC) family protein
MPVYISWQEIALRLVLACVASFIIGLNRDEQGHSAGLRTTMLVCLAATLAEIQMNMLLPTLGKTQSSFSVIDVARLPLGILSGIGFIGAGVIVKHGTAITGVTTAATMWFVTVLGLLFGAGEIYLGIAGSLISFAVLWLLKMFERVLPREYRGMMKLTLSPEAPDEAELRRRILTENLGIGHWAATYEPAAELRRLECELKWRAPASRAPQTPPAIAQFRELPGVRAFVWEQ